LGSISIDGSARGEDDYGLSGEESVSFTFAPRRCDLQRLLEGYVGWSRQGDAGCKVGGCGFEKINGMLSHGFSWHLAFAVLGIGIWLSFCKDKLHFLLLKEGYVEVKGCCSISI